MFSENEDFNDDVDAAASDLLVAVDDDVDNLGVDDYKQNKNIIAIHFQDNFEDNYSAAFNASAADDHNDDNDGNGGNTQQLVLLCTLRVILITMTLLKHLVVMQLLGMTMTTTTTMMMMMVMVMTM